MIKAKHIQFKQLIAIMLVFVFLLQWLPTEAIANALENASAKSSYTPGDVNGDGYINAMDVNLVRRHIAGGYKVNINALAADVNADGYVDART